MNLKSMLIVCIGNTCRSPMAEALAKRRWPNCNITSAGTSTAKKSVGPADEAIIVMNAMNLDISSHRTKGLESLDPSAYEIIVALDKGARSDLIKKFGIDENKIVNMFVKDPYGGDLEPYIKCANEIKRKLATISL